MEMYRMDSGNAAYDLRRFASSPATGPKKKKPVLVVAKPSAQIKAKAKAKAALKSAAVVAILAAVVIVMLCSRAMLTELNEQLAELTNQLNDAKSDVTRLSTEVEAKMSLRNVEEYASQRLGMTPLDPKTQVTYIQLSQGDKVELTEASPEKSWWDELELAINNVQEYIS